MPLKIDQLKRAPVAVSITLLLIGAVELIDYVTGPLLNVSIAYFLPIMFAAWALGRTWAYAAVLLAEIPIFTDQIYLIRIGEATTPVAISNVVVRLVVFGFAAEATWRLVRSREQIRRTAEQLRATGEELRAAYESIDMDVKAAGLLQSSILEFDLPDIPGLQVGASIKYAGTTGGDLADAGMLDDRLYVCTADVSGKGVPAALFTTLLKHLLLEAHDKGLRRADVVADIDRALCRLFPPEYFITLIYAEIEPSTGRVEYVNAGHPEGIIYRSNTAGLEYAEVTGGLLGVADVPGARSDGFVLRQGDSLTLYTDGATDSRTPKGRRLGEDAIRRLVLQFSHIDAQAMADSIRAGIEAATDPDLRDDLAIICVKLP